MKRPHLLSVALLLACLFPFGCSSERELLPSPYPLTSVEVHEESIRIVAARDAALGDLVDLRMFGEFAQSGLLGAEKSLKVGERRANDFGAIGFVARRNVSGGEPVEIFQDLVGIPANPSPQANLCPQILAYLEPGTRFIFVSDALDERKVEVSFDGSSVTKMRLW